MGGGILFTARKKTGRAGMERKMVSLVLEVLPGSPNGAKCGNPCYRQENKA